jgi:hypothetical protein
LTLIVIIVASVGLGVALIKGRALDAESKAFVDAAIPAISATWSKQQLLDRATPELRDIAKPDQLNAMFDRLSQLGPLVKYEGATGQSGMTYMIGSGSTVAASYVAKAQFQNGGAVFRIVLRKRDGRWMIHNFHVDPVPGNRAGQGT